jgi:transcriptional regulator with XRE-family HTH domain
MPALMAEKRANRTDDIPKKIGARMRYFRETVGLSVTDVAERLHVTKGHISATETRDGNLSFPLFLRYAKAIGVPAAKIIGEQAVTPKDLDFERLAHDAMKALGERNLKWMGSLTPKESDRAVSAARDAVKASREAAELSGLRKKDRTSRAKTPL